MRHPINRRMTLIAASAAVVLAITGTLTAQPEEMQGVLQYETGLPIPKGQVEIHVEYPTVQTTTQQGPAQMQLESRGKDKAITFPLPPSATLGIDSDTVQIVARLEREDGWLLARGATSLRAGQPVSITLNTVMY